MSDRIEHLVARVEADLAGLRLDQALAALFPDFSRSRLQQWVRQGQVSVDGHTVLRPRDRVYGGEQVVLDARLEDQVESRPEAIPLDILHQDRALIVINKPAGMVVHPAAGNRDGTLQNALLYHDSGLIQLPRAGIVHRLDKETTGLLVVARTPAAYKSLVAQLQAREVKREYRAIVCGVMVAGGTLAEPIGRHPVHRTRMAVVPSGKSAVTHYRVLERFRAHSYLQVNLETGRTHQIRVHMANIRYPLIGDPAYGGRLRLPAGASPALRQQLRGFCRQALHARRLGFVHPASGDWVEWEREVPADMADLLAELRRDAEND